MEQFFTSLTESAVQLLVVVVLSLGSYGVKKANDFIKSKLSDNQYKVFRTLSEDIYNYVENEFGEKLKEAGAKKLQRAMQVFKQKKEKYNLPFDVDDFKVQIERINKQKKETTEIKEIHEEVPTGKPVGTVNEEEKPMEEEIPTGKPGK